MRFFYIAVVMAFLAACSSKTAFLVEKDKDQNRQSVKIFQTASPGGNCSATQRCTSGYTCDYYQSNISAGSTVGTCQKVCATNTDCGGQVCSPITRTCQPFCSATSQPCSGNPIGFGDCSSTTQDKGYCFLKCNSNDDCSTNMPGDAVCNRGVCVAPCSVGCMGTGQTCDQTTGGCGVACSAGGSECTNLSLPFNNTSRKGLNVSATACSNYSATCVIQAQQVPGTNNNPPQYVCPGTLVEVPEGSSLVCEMPCTNNNTSCPDSAANAVCTKDGQANICATSCSLSDRTNCAVEQQCTSASSGLICQYVPVQNGQCQDSTQKNGYCVPYSCTGQKPSGCEACAQCGPNGWECPCSGETPTCSSTGTCECSNASCSSGLSCTAGKCQGSCGTEFPQGCPSGKICKGGACVPVPPTNSCGSGVLDANKKCDDGSVRSNGNDVSLNGRNGRCNSQCTGVCAVFVDPVNGDDSNTGKDWSNAFKTINNAISSLSSTNKPNKFVDINGKQITCTGIPQVVGDSAVIKGNLFPDSSKGYNTAACPCGYGIWVAEVQGNTPIAIADVIALKHSIALLGGFQSGIYDPRQRKSSGSGDGTWDISHPSGTVLDGSGTQAIFQVVTGQGQSVILDGFQVNNGTVGIEIQAGTTATIEKFWVTGNSSHGIKNSGSLTLKDSYVMRNNTNDVGGAGIYNGPSATNLDVENTVFYGNGGPTASSTPPTLSLSSPLGGAIYDVSTGGGGTVQIERSKFIGNFSYVSGGAIYWSGNSTLTIKNSGFFDNFASSSGGAIYGKTGTVTNPTLERLSFIDNKSYQEGGAALYFESGVSTAQVSKNQFINNKGFFPINQVGDSGYAEWFGDQPGDPQIRQVNIGSSYQSGIQGNGLITMGSGNNQLCPYLVYDTSSSTPCDGTSTCGPVTPVAGYNSSPYIQSPAQTNVFSAVTTCCVPENCEYPNYLNCTYQSSQCCPSTLLTESACISSDVYSGVASQSRRIHGVKLQSKVGSLELDLNGIPFVVSDTNSSSAYQSSSCSRDTLCPSDKPYCVAGTCRACRNNNDCLNQADPDASFLVCFNGTCQDCNDLNCGKNECDSNFDCAQRLADGVEGSSPQKLVCASIQDGALGQCVHCVQDADCQNTNLYPEIQGKYCDYRTYKCVECLADSQCVNGKKCTNNQCGCDTGQTTPQNPICRDDGNPPFCGSKGKDGQYIGTTCTTTGDDDLICGVSPRGADGKPLNPSGMACGCTPGGDDCPAGYTCSSNTDPSKGDLYSGACLLSSLSPPDPCRSSNNSFWPNGCACSSITGGGGACLSGYCINGKCASNPNDCSQYKDADNCNQAPSCFWGFLDGKCSSD